MTVRVAINGFGRVGRCFLRSAHMRDANIEVVAINDVADAGTLAALLRHDSVYGRFPELVAVAEGALRVGESRIADLLGGRSRPAALGGARCRCRDRVDRTLPHPRGRRAPSRSRRAQGRDLSARQGERAGGRERRPGCQLRRGLRPRAPPHHHERIVHDQLSRPGREGPARGDRHPARPHDDNSCLHRGPEPPRRAPQGPAPGTRRGDQPGPDLDGCGEGCRPGDPGARWAPAGLCRARACADRLASRPHRSRRSGRPPPRRSRPSSASAPIMASSRASSPTARSRSSRRTSSGRTTPPSSTLRSRRSSTARR